MTAAAGSGGGETWCAGSIIYWDFDLDHPEKEENQEGKENQMCKNNVIAEFSMSTSEKCKHFLKFLPSNANIPQSPLSLCG